MITLLQASKGTNVYCQCVAIPCEALQICLDGVKHQLLCDFLIRNLYWTYLLHFSFYAEKFGGWGHTFWGTLIKNQLFQGLSVSCMWPIRAKCILASFLHSSLPLWKYRNLMRSGNKLAFLSIEMHYWHDPCDLVTVHHGVEGR